MKKLTGYFLKGLLIFVPAALTVSILVWVFVRLDTIFSSILKTEIPGLGLVIAAIVILTGITLIGFVASNFLGRKAFGLVDRMFAKMPVVKLLYSSLKDFIGAFAGEKKSFDKPVVVEMAPGGPLAAGFITRQSVDLLGIADHVAVYFPHSYNFSGYVLMFPSDRVRRVNIDSSEAMAFIVSGGVTGGSLPGA
jgi:uncharacterized membrane protein